jgi:nucleoid-associated protein YgaU
MHFRDPVVGLCEVLLALAAVWACAVVVSVMVELWRARAAGRRASLRRAVLVCCGVAMVASAPAATADDQHPQPATIAGLPMPDRATGPAHHPTSQHPTSQAARIVVVRPGDCLWHLAAAGLRPGADPDEIAARSHAIYELNRTLIGADPNLILPGQRLVVPAAPSRSPS